jgi:hypothetical protein
VAIRADVADGGARKMDRQHQRGSVGDLAKEAPTRLRGLRRVRVKDGRPIRLPALQRMMHQVAGHDRVAALRMDIDAAMVRRVTRRRRQREIVIELKRIIDNKA